MSSNRKGWDWWSEVKLAILRDYLAAFTLACSKRSPDKITCLDLFAGALDNERRHEQGTFAGSARVALETEPPFTRLAFFELGAKAKKLEADISACRPTDDRWNVFAGDCNTEIGRALAWLGEQYRWAPTFAFIDPRGLQVQWTTLETLARWRKGSHKTELWMLFPEPALQRVLGLRGVRGQSSADALDGLFGCTDWIAIHQLRQFDLLDPASTRAEFVNLVRWRLETGLGYRTTHALQFETTSRVPVYTMVFATDHTAGSDIMAHVYNNASAWLIPEMRARAQAARQKRRGGEYPQGQLFGDDVVAIGSGDSYEHFPPWEPPSQLPEDVVLDDEPQEPELPLEDWMDQLDADD